MHIHQHFPNISCCLWLLFIVNFSLLVDLVPGECITLSKKILLNKILKSKEREEKNVNEKVSLIQTSVLWFLSRYVLCTLTD